MKKSVKKPQRKVTKRSPFKARGISKIVLVAIVAVVLVGALVGAGGVFFLTQRGGSGASSALPFVKPALNSNCKYNDPELCKFINNFPTQTNYSVSSVGTFDKMKSESIYEISGEDAFHMVSKIDGKENLNTITIKDTTYTLDYSDNKWWKQTSKPDEKIKTSAEEILDKNTFTKTDTEDKTTYKFIAKEPCGTLTCFKYEMLNSDTADTKMFMWFDDRDYFMRKMRVEDASSMSNESTYSYGSVSITPPSPIKEGTPDAFGGGGTSQEINEAEVQQMMEQYKKQKPSDQSGFDSEAPVEYNASEE